MRKLVMLVACAMLTALVAGNAAAEDLRGRLAVSAKLGVTNPVDNERNHPDGKLIVDSDAGIIGGGGFFFGIDDNIALEINMTRSSYHTSGFGTAGVTDLAVGAQYRFPERQRFVPYVGAGVDVLINSLDGNRYVDTVVGMHGAAGIDYMAMRQVALTAELKGVQAFSSDVKEFGGGKVGEFDPSSLSLLVGARFFFN